MQLLIWGTGGPASHLLSILEKSTQYKYDRIAFLQDSPVSDSHFMGYPIIGNREALHTFDFCSTHVFVAGSTPSVRFAMVNFLEQFQFTTPTFIDPNAVVRSSVVLGKGCLIQAFALIAENTVLGDYVLMGNYASVAHDCKVGDFVSLYVNSHVMGYVQIEEGCMLGAGTHIFPSLKLGAWSKASMASAIFDDVPAFSKWVGNPAQIKRQYDSPQRAQLYSISSGTQT